MQRWKSSAVAALMGATLVGAPALAAEGWDMPMAYLEGNFHTKNG